VPKVCLVRGVKS